MNRHFINGRYVAGQTGETLAKLDPATGEEFARIACGNAADIDAAVTAARAAFDGAWGRLT
ncbi:aldehyde dehydrogenase family protein, partial [Salmonella enterica]